MSINSINSTISGAIMSQGMRSRPDPEEKFQQLDADSSGTLDKTELSDLAKELSKMGKTLDIDASITTYDADGDGALSQEETDTMMRETMGPPPEGGGPDRAEMFKALDSDGSGGLNMTELEAMGLNELTGESTDTSESISTYDTDGNGELSQEELEAMMQEKGPPTQPPERIGGASARQIADAYRANSGEESLSRLQQILDQLATDLSVDGDTSST